MASYRGSVISVLEMSQNVKHHIEVSSVSLVDLKAEISRRQVEVKQQARTLPEGCSVISKNADGISGKRNSLWCKRSKSPKREDLVSSTDDQLRSAEETEQLERSRRSLEAKTKLYEALQLAAMSGSTSYSASRLNPDDEEGVLVDFEEKAHQEREHRKSPSPPIYTDDEGSEDERDYPAACSDEEWEEYTDDRGMKRRCMRQDMPTERDGEPPPRPDGPLTYAHLREGEIRDHGVGFYAFSENVEVREAEMARLKELHRATEEGRARSQAIRTKRDAKMGHRLAQLRARKGLPDVATAAAQCLAHTSAPPTPLPASLDTHSDIQLTNEDLDVASMLRRLRDEAEIRMAMTNPIPIYTPKPVEPEPMSLADVAKVPRSQQSREWDRGKSMVSAQRYIGGERNKRQSEFAPPSYY